MINFFFFLFKEFINNLSQLHFFISQIVYETSCQPPSFKCEAKPDGTLRLHYYSHRQNFAPFVKGICILLKFEHFDQLKRLKN